MSDAVHTMQSPRTLVISEQPFCLSNGFGVTLSTYFTGWPSDNLMEIHTSAHAVAQHDICPRIHYADIPGHWGRRYALPFFLGKSPTWRGRYSRRWLRRTLGGWQPEVVYSLVISGWTSAYAQWVAHQCQCPWIIHVADDAIERLRNEPNPPTRDLMADAACRLAISHEMKLEYEQRYGLGFGVLHNGAADNLFANERQAVSSANHTPFTIRYLGSILPSHQFNAIEDIAAAVKQLSASGVPIVFEMCGGEWTKEHALPLTDGQSVVYRGAVDREQGFALLKAADLLIIPVSFSPDEFSFVRLSYPTKLPEYLASGTPTLVYGPRGVAPVEFCLRHHVGHAITTRSTNAVSAWLTQAIRDRAALRIKADTDRQWAQQHVSATAVRSQFKTFLTQAITGSSGQSNTH